MVRRKKRTIELEFKVLNRLMNHTLWEAFNKWHWNHYATLKGLMTFQSKGLRKRVWSLGVGV